MAQTTHTQSVKSSDNNANCGNTIRSHHKTVYRSDRDAQMIRWLSPSEPNNRHHGVHINWVGGAGYWLSDVSEFREWNGGGGRANKAVLFFSGNLAVAYRGEWPLWMKRISLTGRNSRSLVIGKLCDRGTKEDRVFARPYHGFPARQW